MPNTAPVFVVQEHGGTVVRVDLMEGVPEEVLVTHNLVIAEFVECLLHPVEVPLELLGCCFPVAFEQLFPIV